MINIFERKITMTDKHEVKQMKKIKAPAPDIPKKGKKKNEDRHL